MDEDFFLGERIRMLMRLRTGGITNTSVLGAMESIPREYFVEEHDLDRAYEDTALPILGGQTVSQPSLIATMIHALDLNGRQRVLEIGTGSGYQSAILSLMARRVYTIERHRELLRAAEARFQAMQLGNITSKYADGVHGWSEAAPFERIILTASCPVMPEAVINQMVTGGVMVAPVGEGGGQFLYKIIKETEGYTAVPLMPGRFAAMQGGVER